MPPEQVTCDRNQLTSYTGVISAIEVSDNGFRITIETDWDTVETVKVSVAEDLKPGKRITAWVCGDCKTPPYIQHLPD